MAEVFKRKKVTQQQSTGFEFLTEAKDRIEHAVKDEFEIVKQKKEMIEKTFRMYIGSIEEAPLFLRCNSYIHGGYRIDFHQYSEVLSSLFSIHNETVNIWSHLLGLIIMIICFTYTLFNFDFLHFSDLMYFVLFFLGACAMFLLSTLYHLFNCIHDHKVYNQLLMCDYVGIFSMIMGSAVSALHFSFHCFWLEKTLYQIGIVAICIMGVLLVILPKYEDKHTLKLLFYLASVSFSALPIAHMAVTLGFYDTTKWWVLIGLYATGVAIYVSKFPECKFPGKFDFWFSSHQLWHFFILMAGCWHYYSLVTIYQERVMKDCPSPI